jgi:putative GTP pyrophosphokinase
MAEESDPHPSWTTAYQERRALYEGFADRLKTLLEGLVAAEGIDVVQVDARAKNVESFVGKLAKKPGKYTDPFTEMHDLAGVRVIAYYLSDVARIDALIEREFAVDEGNSWKREERTDPDRFGYASDHYVVSCSSPRADLTEWQTYSNLRAEIQVRTVLQHAWADIDHKLEYKRATDIPSELRRQLSRVSALLEVADEQFEAARSASGLLEANYESRAKVGDLDLPIDGAAVHAYLSGGDRVRQLAETAAAIGFTVETADFLDGISELIQSCHDAGFQKVADLDEFLAGSERWIRDALAALWGQHRAGIEWKMPVAFLLATVVWIGHDVDLDRIREATDSDAFFMTGLASARAKVAMPNT